MDILLASSNKHKKEELEELLRPYRIHLPEELGIHFECEETGTTFEENALLKALTLIEMTQGITDMPVLADDSGLIVDALPGELGVHTARFGSKDGVTVLPAAQKNMLLIKRLEGVECEKRGATFHCVLALVERNGKKTVVEGLSRGRILEQPDGIGGFGYDPVFFNNEAGCPNSALGNDKGRYSHRGKAARMMKECLDRLVQT